MNEKNVKITKGLHAFKGSASSYNFEILNSFNPKLQLKDAESAIKNQLIDLLSELKGFKFVTTLVLEFKRHKVMIKHHITPFIRTQKQKQLFMKVTLMMYSTITSNIQKTLGQGSGWIIDSVKDHNVNISKYNPLV